MKTTRLYTLLLVVMVSCVPQKEDINLYLSAEQLKFITTAHAGDTVIWEQDGGLRDTGIVQPLVVRRYLEDSDGNPNVYDESAMYSYAIVGSNKFIKYPIISVQTNGADNSLLKTTAHGGGGADGVFLHRTFGGVDYSNVFWGVLKGTTDTTFWSAQGYLGDIYSGVRVQRVK
jgi:hypothetical protein